MGIKQFKYIGVNDNEGPNSRRIIEWLTLVR